MQCQCKLPTAQHCRTAAGHLDERCLASARGPVQQQPLQEGVMLQLDSMSVASLRADPAPAQKAAQ